MLPFPSPPVCRQGHVTSSNQGTESPCASSRSTWQQMYRPRVEKTEPRKRLGPCHSVEPRGLDSALTRNKPRLREVSEMLELAALAASTA